MKNMAKLILTLLILGAFTSCSESHFREDKIFAGGKYVTAKTLNKGKTIYTEYCMPCHGVNGDGKGVASKGMKVPPRDFTKGIFKFGHVLSGELPHDKDIFELLKKGLNGTAMLPWDLKPEQENAVVQYIKTFAPEVWEGKDKELGAHVVLIKDPYGLAHKSAAIAKGKAIYHGEANCQSCHRAYIGVEELGKITEEDPREIDMTSYQQKPQETEWGFQNIPPDFTWDSVRSARTVEDLAKRIAYGIGGTSMPAWKDTITDDQIWAVSYYVKSLMDMKDTQLRKDLMNAIKAENKKFGK
ncbi:cytochrome c [Halobacteriovorax sp.]|uniref:c-type cytochrome n=1 Tax=Halobacteriovorax sp. TaxID=2020862 RepID=UPI003563971F